MSSTAVSAKLLSVVMSVYNDARFVEPAVRSLLDQSLPPDEVLIADDGSTDGSGDILERLAAQDARIRLFRRSNHGIVDSVNFLLGHAQGRYIARMDGDDVSLPERFAREVAFLETHPNVGAVSCQLIEIDEQDRVIDASFRHPTDAAAIAASFAATLPLCNPGSMFRRALLDQLGGYRRAYRYCEDYDFYLRMSRLADLANLDERLLLYRRSAQQVSVQFNSEQVYGSAVAWVAHGAVLAGGADPTEGLDRLPPLERVAEIFPSPVQQRQLLDLLTSRWRWSEAALFGPEFTTMRQYLAAGGRMDGAWRTVARLLRMGHPVRAAQLAGTLIRN